MQRAGFPGANQAYLVGPHLYLRPVELADAQTATIWRDSPFPSPAEVVEEKLREQLESDTIEDWDAHPLLIACRRLDDQPVGSVEVEGSKWFIGELTIHVDRLLPDGTHAEYFAEIVQILAPWLLYERHMLSIHLSDAGIRTDVRRAVEDLGGRIAVQMRECQLIDGNRQDLIYYQIFNQKWMPKLGPPPAPVFGPVDRHVASPAPSSRAATSDFRPDDAMVLGERVYLRPFKTDEGKLVAEWSMQETEVYYPEGRSFINAHVYGHSHSKMARAEIPAYIGFAIVDRQSGALIGANGLEVYSWTNRVAETQTEIYRPEHRSAGYGTEAKHLLLEYAFERIGLHAVVSWVAEINTRSAAALRKQGYRDAGLIAWDSICDDSFCGYNGFDLLADEWRNARDRAKR